MTRNEATQALEVLDELRRESNAHRELLLELARQEDDRGRRIAIAKNEAIQGKELLDQLRRESNAHRELLLELARKESDRGRRIALALEFYKRLTHELFNAWGSIAAQSKCNTTHTKGEGDTTMKTKALALASVAAITLATATPASAHGRGWGGFAAGAVVGGIVGALAAPHYYAPYGYA